MDMMNLDKNNSMLIDDLFENVNHARKNGYKILHVAGNKGLN